MDPPRPGRWRAGRGRGYPPAVVAAAAVRIIEATPDLAEAAHREWFPEIGFRFRLCFDVGPNLLHEGMERGIPVEGLVKTR